MYARTTYAIGDPAQIEHSLEGLRNEAPKLLADSPGFRSFNLLADRELGKITMATWWETSGDRAASDEHLGERRTGLLTPFADSISVDDYEVVAMARTPEISEAGTFRLGRFEIEPARIDELAETFREVALPRFADLSGFRGAAMLLNRDRGRGAVGTLFSDRSALRASRTPQSAMRGEATRRFGMRVLCLEEFDVVLLESNPGAE